MNRPTIKKILNDAALSESEKIDQIFAVYTASTSKLKTEEDLQKAVENAQKGLNVKETEQYKELESKLKERDEELEKAKTEAGEKISEWEFDRDLNEALKAAKVKDPKIILPLLNRESLKRTDKGIEGLDEQLKPFTETHSYLFDIESQAAGQGSTPTQQLPSGVSLFQPDGTKPGGGEKNPWMKETRNIAEQTRIYREDPSKAMAMAKAAGVNL